MCVDYELYGVASAEKLADDVTLELSQEDTSLALKIVEMLEVAKEEMGYDQVAARHTVSRVQFLIRRFCSVLGPQPGQH